MALSDWFCAEPERQAVHREMDRLLTGFVMNSGDVSIGSTYS
jgi:hypothetical protein